MASFVDEFKKFAMKGNVVDLAVGVIMGGAFGKIVASLVDDVIMPPLGMLMAGVDFSTLRITLKQGTLVDGKMTEGVWISYGKFINQTINFILVAFAVFLLVKALNAARERFEAKEAAAENNAPPPPKPRQEVLLEEIRDALTKR